MSIVLGPGALRWKVSLSASIEQVYELLTTDAGRERFWSEASYRSGTRIELRFPDGSSCTADVVREDPPRSFALRYFGTLTTFDLAAVTGNCTVLEVRAHDVPPPDQPDVAAGWVSVLLCLKAHLNAGIDLRNHTASRSWQEGFVDN